MSILRELNTILDALGVAVETGVFSGKAPDEYVVITPMTDTFEGFADNKPQYETQEARLSLFRVQTSPPKATTSPFPRRPSKARFRAGAS